MKAVLAGIALCLGSLAAHAALVEYNFTASLKDSIDAGSGPWLQSLSAGTIGTGSFVIDTSIPSTYGPNPYFGEYLNGFASGTFSIGGMSVTSSAGIEIVQVVPGGAAFLFIASQQGHADGIDAAWNFYNWGMWLESYKPEFFSGIAFPDTFDMAIYSSREFGFSASNGGQPVSARFELTSIEKAVANTVPEPASFALVGAGLLGIAALRRRRVERR